MRSMQGGASNNPKAGAYELGRSCTTETHDAQPCPLKLAKPATSNPNPSKGAARHKQASTRRCTQTMHCLADSSTHSHPPSEAWQGRCMNTTEIRVCRVSSSSRRGGSCSRHGAAVAWCLPLHKVLVLWQLLQQLLQSQHNLCGTQLL